LPSEHLVDSSFLKISTSSIEEEQIKKSILPKRKQLDNKLISKKSLRTYETIPELHQVPLKKPVVACYECGKIVQRRSLHDHISFVHTKKYIYFCDLCGRGFYKKYNLMSHLYSHIPPDLRDRNHICPICSKTFFCKQGLNTHQKETHAKIEPGKELNCECGKQFKNRNGLRQHKRKIHNREEFLKTCEHCGKVISDATKLKKHIRIFHTEGGRGNFMCSECGKLFDQKQELSCHQRIHVKPTIPCDEPGCDKMFRRLNLMEHHKKISHLKVKNHKCDHENCGKGFATFQKLKRHIKVTHEKHREKCPVEDCKFMVGRRDYMKNHIRKHVELKPEVQTQMLESVSDMQLI
jgi:uncharacterized Zn-finger protein